MRSLIPIAVATLTVSLPAAGGLTEGPRLAAIYNTIIAARFDDARVQIRDACPPAPEAACQTLAGVSLWWQVLINPESRLLDQPLNDAAAAAIATASAWTRREPENAEAWFYLAAAYGPLVQWRVLREERIAAAREGKKVKDALERALRLDPSIDDAYFGIGLYHYYAAVAPAYAKVLRWLMWMPGGDRAGGLREMERARDRGTILGGEADYQLHLAYLWYERQPQRALDLLIALDRRYPTNPLFLQRIAEVRDTYFHDASASASAYRELLERALAGSVYMPSIAEVRARLGIAHASIALGSYDVAIDHARIVIEKNPSAPIGARARAEALMKSARDRKIF
jgi:tetratricopeptide (TPR) repeat protein